MFDTALDALRSGSIGKLAELKPMDERINTYQSHLQAYLAELAQKQLAPEESRRALELTLYISNLEHAGDVIQLNLADRIEAKARESIDFTDDEIASLDNLCRIIHDNLKLATAVLSSGDVEGAKRLISQKDAFRELQNEVLDKHFKIGARGKGEALRRSALYVDMIRDLNRINALVVSAGYPIVDAAGLLRGSRLRHDTA
jgi:phosphate:Na+ symporter